VTHDRPTENRRWLSRRKLLTLAGFAGAGGVIGGAYSSTSVDGEVVRDFPLERVLPSTYREGRADVAPYVQEAMARLEPTGRASLLIPPGRHLWNSPCYFDAGTRDLTYELHGYGRGTILELGEGLRREFGIHLNENKNGVRAVTFPRHPRLRITDMFITASDRAVEASLCHYSEASVDLQRLRLSYLKYGLTGTGYTDLMSLRQLGWEQPAEEGRLYLQNGTGGDGLLIEQVTASMDAVIAELIGCNGAQISSCIGGRLIFEDCDAIEVVAPHYDSHGGTRPMAHEPFMLARSSRVTIRGGWNHVGSLAAAFEIDDSVRDHYSEVTWDGYSFAFRADVPDKERAPDIRVVSVQNGTRLRFRGCSSRLLPRGDRRRWAAGPRLVSDDIEVQAAFDASPTAPLEDAELVRDESGWAFRWSGTVSDSRARAVADPTIEDCSATDLFPGNHPVGVAYHYTLASYSSFAGSGIHSRRSAEASITITEAGKAVALRVALGAPRVAVRVWRGSSPGAYDSFADLTVGASSTLLVDTGPYLCGSVWTALDVPSPPSDNNSR
jgi:hypothetical protein